MKNNIVGAAGVLFRQRNGNFPEVLLVVEREDNPRVKKVRGMIGLSMGHVKLEEGESPREAIEREFLEETGICVRATDFLGIFYLGKNIPVHAFRVEVADRKKRRHELSVRWMSAVKVLTLSDNQVRPPTKVVLQRALQFP